MSKVKVSAKMVRTHGVLTKTSAIQSHVAQVRIQEVGKANVTEYGILKAPQITNVRPRSLWKKQKTFVLDKEPASVLSKMYKTNA